MLLRSIDVELIKKNFGFGAMRLPMKDGEVDIPQTCRMMDAFLKAGFNFYLMHARAWRISPFLKNAGPKAVYEICL